jgi:MraZ protein
MTALSLDSKGRMCIPAKYRDRLRESCSNQLVVTVDRDRCLLIYPLPAWEEVERKLIQLSSMNKAARGLKRLLLGHAEECEMDGSGRILLPNPLREFAGLNKRVVLIGQGNKFELWDEHLWERTREEMVEDRDSYAALSVELDSLSF